MKQSNIAKNIIESTIGGTGNGQTRVLLMPQTEQVANNHLTELTATYVGITSQPRHAPWRKKKYKITSLNFLSFFFS